MASAANGSIGFAFEPTATPGERIGFILAYGNVTTTASAANQPSGSTGMRCHILVYNNTATGTVTITGTDINGNAINETTPTIPIFAGNAATDEQGRFDYLTTHVFGAINASGITTTGLIGGQVMINGVPGARWLMPATAKITPKYGEFSPKEHRALPDLNTHKIQTVKDVDIQFDTTLYPDSSLFAPFALVNSVTNPSTWASSPSSPTSLLAATPVSGSPLSLTTQPTAPGMKLILVIASASASGTITLSGTNPDGESISESINGSGNGTYYSTMAYKSISASDIVVTGFTSGTLAVTGVFGWNPTFFPSLNPFSLTTEWYTGTDSVAVPGCVFEELSLDFEVDKEFKLSMKGLGQDYIYLGNRSTNPLSGQQTSNLAQPVDFPLPVWNGEVFIDPLSNSPGTTQFGDLIKGKITFKAPLEALHKLTTRQTYAVAYRKQISVEFEGTADYTNLLQAEQFRQDFKQYLQFTFQGRNVGAGNYQAMNVIIPFKFNKFDVTSTPEMAAPTVDFAGIGEYDAGIGASYKIVWANTRTAPNYTS